MERDGGREQESAGRDVRESDGRERERECVRQITGERMRVL